MNIKSDKIARYYDLQEKIEKYGEEIIDDPSKYYNKLNECNIKDSKARKEHVKQAKNIVVNKSENEKNMCPKCGTVLIEKEGKYGKFYGCPNYPKCKYTKNK